ncbi:MAG: NAD-dependent dehydratase, partial [Halothiobacillaceae bacterium]
AIGEVVNIGSNYEISIGDTLQLIRELMGSEIEVIHDARRLRPQGSEVFRLWCDNGKIERLTGFKPQVGIREGLARTIAWFTNPDNLKRYKTDIYNV